MSATATTFMLELIATRHTKGDTAIGRQETSEKNACPPLRIGGMFGYLSIVVLGAMRTEHHQRASSRNDGLRGPSRLDRRCYYHHHWLHLDLHLWCGIELILLVWLHVHHLLTGRHHWLRGLHVHLLLRRLLILRIHRLLISHLIVCRHSLDNVSTWNYLVLTLVRVNHWLLMLRWYCRLIWIIWFIAHFFYL